MTLFHRPSSIINVCRAFKFNSKEKCYLRNARQWQDNDMEMMPCLDVTSISGHIAPVLEICRV